MRLFILACLSVGSFAFPAAAQIQGEPIIASGRCDDEKSGVAIDDDDQQPNGFACDTAVITRMASGSVLIQFTDKAGDDGRILGFAGHIEGKQGFGADLTQMLAVQRVYLQGGGEPISVERGTCILNWSGLHRTGGRLQSALCGAGGEADGHIFKAMAVLEVVGSRK